MSILPEDNKQPVFSVVAKNVAPEKEARFYEIVDEVLQEYADPDSDKYQTMVDEICKRLKVTSLRYHRLDDMIESIGLNACDLCTYCWDGKE